MAQTPTISQGNFQVAGALSQAPNVMAIDTTQKTQPCNYVIEFEGATLDANAKSTAIPDSGITGPAVDIASYEVCFLKPVDSQVSAPTFASGKVAASALHVTLPTGPHVPVILEWLHKQKYITKVKVHKLVIVGGNDTGPRISETLAFSEAKIAEVRIGAEYGTRIVVQYDQFDITVKPIDKADGSEKGNVAFGWVYATNKAAAT